MCQNRVTSLNYGRPVTGIRTGRVANRSYKTNPASPYSLMSGGAGFSNWAARDNAEKIGNA